MHGLGDNLHQRAIVRQLMRAHEVFLESSWVAPYHDLIADGLKVIHKTTALRTQAKNASREAARFHRARLPRFGRAVQVGYSPDQVRSQGSVLAAMCRATGTDYATGDFSLPVPAAWMERVWLLLDAWRPKKPILIYRPLIERTEWSGCPARNPDHVAYRDLLAAIRDDFFVVSIADLVPGKEWMVGHPIKADAECHGGELDFETIAGLTSVAALVFTSPGFAAILAQSVGTPAAVVFGGYENATSFAGGARHSPTLGIDPINPCQCFSHSHACQKTIDVPAATSRLRAFAAQDAGRSPVAA
ncbi:hypothetical protein [Mesorhizobium sp. B2-2-1]|uniref:hypothetical protein n=1 Tax=Mesorhizobium sp. B2-2-1 TaxID=2589965 RepID=UPI0015E47DFE|nr:hypothetical protein [Mesorhizobium sp. B2-2-1]